MATRRAGAVFLTAFVFYFFGNQVQVGWLFVISALLGGLLPAAWWINRRILPSVGVERTITPSMDVHEGDEVVVTLTWRNNGRFPLAHIHTLEQCTLAPPDTPERALSTFIPTLLAGDTVTLPYEIELNRRGLHRFPPLQLSSQAPFGFFKRALALAIDSSLLVYPEVKPLAYLDLLHSRRAAEWERPRAGHGSEVLGIRPYRPGDSPRHIHWRSVARTGQLMSKEFADEAQPGLTLALDLYQHPYPTTTSKHTPFEWGVKVTASIAEYAHRANYPAYLIADETALAAPAGAVTWEAWLQYLAHVQPTGQHRLPQLGERPLQTLVTAVLPWPDLSYVETLIEWHHRTTLMVVLLDPATFPDGDVEAEAMAAALEVAGVDVKLIQFGTDWREVLTA